MIVNAREVVEDAEDEEVARKCIENCLETNITEEEE